MIRIRNSALAQAAVEHDHTQRGTREQLDERDRELVAAWSNLRKRAFQEVALGECWKDES